MDARPVDERKGADRGIDGVSIYVDNSGKTKQIIFSVKAGQNINAAYVRDLRGVIEREKAAIGVLITMEAPTKPMMKEAAEAGFYKDESAFDRARIRASRFSPSSSYWAEHRYSIRDCWKLPSRGRRKRAPLRSSS